MSLTSFDPPANLSDFNSIPHQREAWSEIVSSWFDEAIQRTEAETGPGRSQFYNRIKASTGQASAQKTIRWLGFPRVIEKGKVMIQNKTVLASVTILSLAAAFFMLITWTQPAGADDTNPAVNNADKFAWDLFIQINTPVLTGQRGVPDPNKKPGDSGLRVWETWKITTPIGSEVFLDAGKRPGPWDSVQLLNRSGQPRKFLSPRKFTLKREDLLGMDPHVASLAAFRGNPRLDFGQESRINRPGFEFIVQAGLYSIDGQERFRATGSAVEFPIDTIAVKATWRKFSQDEIKAGLPSRFYTTEQDGDIYGLTGLHMTSKAIPNWFWATFEQIDNPPPEIPDRDRYTRLRYPNPATPAEQRMRDVPDPLKNTVWQYYVLRGTQTDFTDSMGNPIILGNTQLENGMQTTASCMSCHARASIGDRVDNIVVNGARLYPAGTFFYPGGRVGNDGSNRLTVDPFEIFWQQDPKKPNRNTAVPIAASANGAPDPNLFIEAGTGKIRYTQLDFLWEFMFAQREPPTH